MVMRKVADGINKVIDIVNDRVGNILSYVIIAITVIIIYEVIARYIFDSPTFWAHESAQLAFGSYAALGGAYTLFHRAHIRVDIIYARFPPVVKLIADVVIFIVFLLFLSVLLWKTAEMAQASLSIRETSWSNWHPVLYPFKMMMPIAAGLMILQGTANFIRDIRQRGRELTQKEVSA